MRKVTSLLELEDAILDLFVKNRITVDIAKTSCWQLLSALYENELIEEPQRREEIISNIYKQTDTLLVNILGKK
ncbi:MAG: hypothetical protein WA364_30735 [Candidatus Nitrosopolaris sp.]